jgi:uncharacterized protein (TIGR00304 family)
LVEVTVAGIGLVLVVLGFILAFVAVILLAIRGHAADGRTRGGGVLLIGPIPIIFGTDRSSVKVLMILAIILIAVVLISALIPSMLLKR